jgi:hypothetical protein
MTQENKKEKMQIAAKVEPSVYNSLHRIASEQDRSVASLIRRAIAMYVSMNQSG